MGIFSKLFMKITHKEEAAQVDRQRKKEELWTEIGDYWYTVRQEPGAVAKCMEKFSVSKNTVITSISFVLKKYG